MNTGSDSIPPDGRSLPIGDHHAKKIIGPPNNDVTFIETGPNSTCANVGLAKNEGPEPNTLVIFACTCNPLRHILPNRLKNKNITPSTAGELCDPEINRRTELGTVVGNPHGHRYPGAHVHDVDNVHDEGHKN